jgi:hypothetical protein
MNKFFRSSLILLTIFLLLVNSMPGTTIIPVTGEMTLDISVGTKVPTLGIFIEQVRNGKADQVTGLYSADLFAYPVITQPADQPAYVYPLDGKITQFNLATSYGSLGFLAHNTLAGATFSNLTPGKRITVVYGDGHTTAYDVILTRRFQATQPGSPYSSFIDLATDKTLRVTDLFMQTYGLKGNLVLQTCITNNGSDSWGRLFIIASPHLPEPANNH